MARARVNGREKLKEDADPAHAVTPDGEASRFAAATSLRFAAVPLLSLAFVILLVGLLNYYKFQTTFEEIAERRIAIVLDRAKSSIESAVDLGLRLEDIDAAPIILGSMPFQEWRVEEAFIFETGDGRVVFSSRPESMGAPVDPALMEAQQRQSEGRWRVSDNGKATLGLRLDSGYGTAIGGVALTYSITGIRADAQAVRGELATAMVVTLVVFALLALIGLHFLSREYRQMAGNLRNALAAPGRDEALPAELRQLVQSFRDKTGEAGSKLSELEQLPDLPGQRPQS